MMHGNRHRFSDVRRGGSATHHTLLNTIEQDVDDFMAVIKEKIAAIRAWLQ
jgi:hypothetical protein